MFYLMPFPNIDYLTAFPANCKRLAVKRQFPATNARFFRKKFFHFIASPTQKAL